MAVRSEQDLRLLAPALAVWLAALLGLLAGWWAAIVVGALAASAGAMGLRQSPVRGDRRRVAFGALLVCGVLSAAPLGVRLLEAEQDDMRGLAARGGEAEMSVTVTERPRPVRSPGYGDQQGGSRSVVIAGELDRAVVGGDPVASTGRTLLIAPFDDWSRILPGQRVTATGSLAPPRSGELTVGVLYVRGPPVISGGAPWFQVAAESMRAALREACSVLPEEPAGLLPGLVVGDTTGLSSRVEEDFLDSGMSHLTAVSGTNVAITCGAVLLTARLLRAGPRFAAVTAGAALLAFLVLVGPEPSVLRAGVMGAIALLALALGRHGSALPALACAVIGLVLWDPAMAVSFGFALSVIATGALVLVAPRWSEMLARKGIPPGFAEGLAVPLAAFVATAPVIAGMAGEISLVAVAANVLAAPVVAPATIFGVLAAALAPWWPGAAEVLVHAAAPEAEWLIFVAREAAGLPWAVLPWPSGWWGGLLAALLAVVAVVALRRRGVRICLALLLAGALLVAVPGQVISPSWPPAGWAITACDVGQGDGLVLATGEPGRAIVVDTGPEPGPVDECLDRLDVERVPLVILSHLHADHIGGLRSVFESRAVGAVAVGPGRRPDWAWRSVAATASAAGVPLLELSVGQRLSWPALTVDVLGPEYVPPQDSSEEDGTGINNTSVVMRAATSAGTVLLTGDVELAAQSDLLASGADLRSDILKVPHHGSRFALPEFLGAAGARVALVSVGEGNRYGHPNPVTLDVLSAGGALIARTDTDGDAAVVPDERGPAVVRRGRQRHPC
ncbi:competence protein ComEC [Amycolatopsis antarctica]|uniref:Competence protein ComEC n=1 Tax=Amycolatopsis antarctica TaxID=1854586 RepID=A0A263D813_9PSEU|nr:ComEC/Rec2 family competence protein [Amycolatopsis antarctica]OZM74620.1 competence protein ComEC [Amycolatopsis antarctica]